jgi:cell division protein FtsB
VSENQQPIDDKEEILRAAAIIGRYIVVGQPLYVAILALDEALCQAQAEASQLREQVRFLENKIENMEYERCADP